MSSARFSIVVTASGKATELRATLDSVRAQILSGWELCILTRDPPGAETAERDDPRVRFEPVDVSAGLAAATNRALADAAGELIVLLDAGEELDPEALAMIDAAVREAPDADIAYTDEECLDSRRRRHAFFKPDWSPERFRAQPYLGRVCALRRAAVDAVGGFDIALKGAHEWDLILRIAEREGCVIHIPRVLCRRCAPAPPPRDRTDAETRAIQAHCDRIGLEARVAAGGVGSNARRLEPALVRRPTVSILIPTGGRSRRVRNGPTVLVTRCLRSIITRSSYDTYEIVCVADASVEGAVLDELRDIGRERLRIVDFDRPFNFSAKLNLGARMSEGEHLLLLNDDTEVVTPSWMERLVMYGAHQGIGAVGARLLWPNDRIQHAGVVFEEGLPGHVYRGSAANFTGNWGGAVVPQNYLAVTGACLLTPRAAFEEVGGFEEELPVNYNDMDYCLKLRTAGRRVVYDPDTVLYHFESSSRRSGATRLEKEWLRNRWRGLADPDPFSNPALHYGVPRGGPLGSRLLARLRRRLG